MADPFQMSQGENFVSFNFNSAPGYDRIGATVHGSPEYVAAAFGIQEFDGKISTLMKQAVAVDAYFKTEYARAAPGKK